MTARLTLLVASIVASGLVAGLLFGWLVSVIPGTSRVDDRTYVSTMQSINVAIINPPFVITFMLTPLVLAIAAAVEYRAGRHRRAITLLSAAAVYVVGVMVVTGVGNVPLNNTLDAVDIDSVGDTELHADRTGYETPWNRWHTLRTAAAAVAFGLAVSSTLVTEAE